MEIILDTREKKLELIINNLLENEKKKIKMNIQQLDVGDIILMKNSKPIIIIERKSISDLASSIYDGRYKEQSFRLDKFHIHNHNIIYLIEGDLNKFNGKGCNKKALLSSFSSIIFYKGFSLMRTLNLCETAEFILRLANKIDQNSMEGYYNLKHIDEGNNSQDVSYTDVVSCKKKNNITPENIGEIMLMQIPGISSVSAKAIMKNYSSLIDLICDIQDNKKVLEKITYTNSSNKERKLNKTCIENIHKYLIQENY